MSPFPFPYIPLAVALLISPLAAAQSTVPEKAFPTSETLETIRRKYDLPALAVVVVKDGQICDRGAVGVRKLGYPQSVTTNDAFHLGSLTKSMTATLAAMFIDEGKLRWDTTIAEVFPELMSRMDKHYQTVTVEQLLTHRGGVPSEPPAPASQRARKQKGSPVEQRREFIAAVLAAPPESTRERKWIYSNQGYSIVGAMLERIANKPWEDLMTEKLFKPLRMDSAGFGPPGTIGKVDQPWGHRYDGQKLKAERFDNSTVFGPSGRVHCSLDDLARFVMIHLQGERTGGLLKPETFRKLHSLPDDEVVHREKMDLRDQVVGYASGWDVVNSTWAGGRVLAHAGSNTRWVAGMWLAPEKNFAVISATNCGESANQSACEEVAAAMIKKWLTE